MWCKDAEDNFTGEYRPCEQRKVQQFDGRKSEADSRGRKIVSWFEIYAGWKVDNPQSQGKVTEDAGAWTYRIRINCIDFII